MGPNSPAAGLAYFCILVCEYLICRPAVFTANDCQRWPTFQNTDALRIECGGGVECAALAALDGLAAAGLVQDALEHLHGRKGQFVFQAERRDVVARVRLWDGAFVDDDGTGGNGGGRGGDGARVATLLDESSNFFRRHFHRAAQIRRGGRDIW